MKTLKELLCQLNENNIFVKEGEENKGWKYKSNEPGFVARSLAIKTRIRRDAESTEKSAKQNDIDVKSKNAKDTMGKASKWGIPYISKLAKGTEHVVGKLVSVSVGDNEDDGKIWWHQGAFHFRHPSGKIHNDVTLQSSVNGIAIMPKMKPGKRTIKAIAHIPASRNAVALKDEDFAISGKKLVRK